MSYILLCLIYKGLIRFACLWSSRRCSDPIAFFEHEVPRECNLQFIDLAKIDPPSSRAYTWIMYMGDTISYDLYAAAVQRLTGYDPSVNAEEVKLTRLGKHLGPQGDITHEEVVGNIKTRPEYLVCCRAQYHPQGDGNSDGSDSCVMGVSAKSAMWNKNILKMSKFYLFDDIATYIRDVIELLYMGSYKCISFSWAADFWEASVALTELNAAGSKSASRRFLLIFAHLCHAFFCLIII